MDIIKALSKFPGNMREGHAKRLHENTIIRIRIRSSTGNQDEKKSMAEIMFINLRKLFQRKYAGLLNMQMNRMEMDLDKLLDY